MDRGTARTRPILEYIGSHGYPCLHAAAKCGSNGFGATSASKGAPPPPWEKTKVNCELCHDTHRGTPHARLVHCAACCPIFLQEWVRTWRPWADLAQQWLTTASPEDLNHISKLRIPLSFVDSAPPPPPKKRDLRYRVVWHQYHMIHATALLGQSLTMPPAVPGACRIATASTPMWYMSLRRKAIQQYPTDDTLRTQVNYKPKQWDKHARGPKRASRNLATKAHKLLHGPITINTSPPPYPSGKPPSAEADLLHVHRTPPPPPPGETPAATPGTETPVHHEQGRPHPPHVDHS